MKAVRIVNREAAKGCDEDMVLASCFTRLLPWESLARSLRSRAVLKERTSSSGRRLTLTPGWLRGELMVGWVAVSSGSATLNITCATRVYLAYAILLYVDFFIF